MQSIEARQEMTPVINSYYNYMPYIKKLEEQLNMSSRNKEDKKKKRPK